MSESFNATDYLVGRRLAAGEGDRVAVRAPSRTLTYAELDAEVGRVAAGLAALAGLAVLAARWLPQATPWRLRMPPQTRQ